MDAFLGCFWIPFLKNLTDASVVRPPARCSLFSFRCFQFFFILFSSDLCTQGLDSHYTGREAPSRRCQLAATIRSQWENYRYTFALPSTLLSLLLFWLHVAFIPLFLVETSGFFPRILSDLMLFSLTFISQLGLGVEATLETLQDHLQDANIHLNAKNSDLS